MALAYGLCYCCALFVCWELGSMADGTGKKVRSTKCILHVHKGKTSNWFLPKNKTAIPKPHNNICSTHICLYVAVHRLLWTAIAMCRFTSRHRAFIWSHYPNIWRMGRWNPICPRLGKGLHFTCHRYACRRPNTQQAETQSVVELLGITGVENVSELWETHKRKYIILYRFSEVSIT